jgi:hypothetical protein
MPLPPRLARNDVIALLERANADSNSARDELRYAQSIAAAAGLTVNGSALDNAYYGGGDGVARSSAGGGTLSLSEQGSSSGGGGGTMSGTIPPMDVKQEAQLAIQARHRFNPLRGTLSAFPLVLTTTGGHSNTDHVIQQNPDGTVDRLAEYRRMMKRRRRRESTEERGSDRWDLPRIPGGRRRRIRRDADAAGAPPEPPLTGYVIYVSQMTTKLRHDNPDRHHDQISAIRRISNMWNKLVPADKAHYSTMAREARAEYDERLMEYRATGLWSPYTAFERLTTNKNGVSFEGCRERTTGSNGPWVRMPYEKKNELEKEIGTYEQVIFPPRPAGLEGDREEVMAERKRRRREQIQKECEKFNTPILS